MTSKVKFSDFSGETQTVESCWNLKECVDSSSQTPEELFQFSENEMQTGIKTEIVQDEVKAKYEGKWTGLEERTEDWRRGAIYHVSFYSVTIDLNC